MWSQTEYKCEEKDHRDSSNFTQASPVKTCPEDCSTAIQGEELSEKVALTMPLSVCTADMSHVTTRDIAGWVTRSASIRQKEAKQREGYIARPLNSFMLYRAAFIKRARAWCRQNKQQVLSQVIGASWKMEPPELRECYERYAKLEQSNHSKAHPTYKFSPRRTRLADRKEQKLALRKRCSNHPLDLQSVLEGNERHRPPATMDSHVAPSTHVCPGFGETDHPLQNRWQPKPPEAMIGLSQYPYQQCYRFEYDCLPGYYSGQAFSPVDMSVVYPYDPITPHDAQMGTCYASPDASHCVYFPYMHFAQPNLVYDGEDNSKDYSPTMMLQTPHDVVRIYDYDISSGYTH